VALVSSAPIERMLTAVRDWARDTKTEDGSSLLDQAWVRANLAQVSAEIEFLKVLNAKLALEVDRGDLAAADASVAKVFGSELTGRARRLLFEIVGLDVVLDESSPGNVLGGELAKSASSSNVLTFIGGVSEVQRDIIAQMGLGLPRTKRS